MKNLITFMFLVNTLLLQAQDFYSIDNKQPIIDSLKKEISFTKSDSVKCILNFEIANIYAKDNNQYYYKVYNKNANDLIRNNSYLKDISLYYNSLKYIAKGDYVGYQNSLILANNKLKKFKDPKSYKIRAMIFNNLSRFKNDKEKVEILIEKAIPLAKKAGDRGTLAIIYKSLSRVFLYVDLEKSEYYTNLSINTLLESNKKSFFYYEVLVENYLMLAEINIYKSDLISSKLFLEKSYSLLQMDPNSNLFVLYYSTIVHYHYEKKNYRRALFNIEKGIVRATLDNDFSTVNRFRLMKFNIYKQTSRYEDAKKILLETLDEGNIDIVNKKNYSQELSYIFKQLNDFQNALKYSEQYIELNDSIDEINYKKEIAKIETNFKNKENVNKIKELEVEKQKSILTAKYNRLNIFVIGLISIMLLTTTLFLLKNSKSQRRIANQNEVNYKQTLNAIRIKRELEVTQAMIDGQEAERKRIGRDLHDGIGSRLSALKMQLPGIVANDSNPDKVINFSNSLSQSIIELREIAFNLMPETLLKLGLEAAIKDLCHSLCNEKVFVVFHSNGIDDKIKANNQITIFRIVQELISNALKHSDCSEIIVDCSQNSDLFLITVEDNGKGFITSEIDSFNGLGFKNIKNRIELLNGKLEINSKLNKGTFFNIELRVQLDS